MELTGEKVITAPRQRVYDALHDTVILRQAIPGCQAMTKAADGRYEATVALKFGPLKSNFFGTIHVYNEDPPSGYSLRAEASGGLSGNASGDAHIALASIDDQTTNLAYHVRADVNGQLGTLDSRQLESAARVLVAEFFSRLETALDTSRFVATSAPTTDSTGAPTGGWEPRRVAAADNPDETAYSASQYTRSDAPTRGSPETAVSSSRFETAGPPRFVTAPATTDALGEPSRPAANGFEHEDAGLGYEPTAGASRDFGRSGIDTFTGSPRFGQGSRATTDLEPPRSGSAIWRWFLVLVGLGAIAALLTDLF